jgi:K+-transporting ATPase ATPase C chain
MIRVTSQALSACVVTFVLCSVVYPAVVWGVGQALFPRQAAGSLIYGPDGSTVIGSELIAQPFASDKYFSPRPSAVDYKADAAGGSNLGPKHPDLRAKIKERARALDATAANPAPVDLVTASGSGLDPHISPEAAYYQAPRVASARGTSVEEVRALVDRLTVRSGAVIGAPARVNVLQLNLALDEAGARGAAASAQTKSRSNGLGDRPAVLADAPARVAQPSDRIGSLDDRVKGTRNKPRGAGFMGARHER